MSVLALGLGLLLASCTRPEPSEAKNVPEGIINPPIDPRDLPNPDAPMPANPNLPAPPPPDRELNESPFGGFPLDQAEMERLREKDEQERREYEAKYSLAERKKIVEAMWSLPEEDKKAIDEIIAREKAKTVGALSSSELNDLVIKEVLRRAGTFPVTAQVNPFERWAQLNQLEQRLSLTSPV